MKTKRILSFLVVVAMMVSLFTAIPTFATSTGEIGLDLSNSAPAIGDIVTAKVYVKDIPTIAGIQVTLGYNPAVLTLWNKTTDAAATTAVNGINTTTFLALTDPDGVTAFSTTAAGNKIDATKGLIDWNCSTELTDIDGNFIAYTVPGPTTNLTVIYLRFKVIAAGSANLRIAKQASGGNYTTTNPLGYLIKAVVGAPNLTGLTETFPSLTIAAPNQNQAAPTGLAGVAPTSIANNDGKISGTSTAMEYKKVGDVTYTAVTGAQITGLASGDYLVRLAAKTGYNASPDTSVNVPVYVPPATLSSIAITTAPTKTVYTVGDTLDLTGLVVTGTYSDTTSKIETVTAANVTGFDNQTAGPQTLTVTVGGKTATFNVTVNAPVMLSSIAVTTPANKLVYTVGDTLDITGLVVTGTYTDTSTKVQIVTTDDVSGFNSSVATASQTLTITIGGKTTTYTVEIKDPILSSIAVTTQPTKTVYTVGDTLDLTGLVVTGTYNNLTIKTETVTTANVTGFNNQATGTQTLTVTVGGKTTTFDVTVNAAPLSTNANLSALSVTGATLNETFAANSLVYTATVANDVTSVTINATKADSKAIVAGDGAQILAVGLNTFNVTVTAEDTNVTKTYVVKITREYPPVVGAVIKAGDVSDTTGQNVIVPITITKMTGLNSYAVKVSYKTSKLSYVTVTKGLNITETPELDLSKAGEISIAGLTVAHGVAGLSGDVVVAYITFKVIDTAAGSSTVTVLAGRYNGITVVDPNFTNGTVTYTVATDSVLKTATEKVEAYETAPAATIAEIDAVLATESTVKGYVDLVTLPESATKKQELYDRITNRTKALNDEKTVLQAEDTATQLVLAYENASLDTLSDVQIAEGKGTDAYNAVNALRLSQSRTDLLNRISKQDTKVLDAKKALAKAEALKAINAGTAALAQYQLIDSSATLDLIANYNRGVVAQGSALTEAQVKALILQVNTPKDPVITDVTIVGQAVEGVVLTAKYKYFDANYDLEVVANTVISWSVNGTPITPAEAAYTVATADVGKPITVTVAGVASSVSLPVILRGDVDGSGSVNENDGYYIREIYHGTFTGTPEMIAQKVEAADYDKSGAVNSLDWSDVIKVGVKHID